MCREQRVTHVAIFVTIGLSVLMTPMLSHIPMPVLYGVFLYMGVASLNGLQFFDRILLVCFAKHPEIISKSNFQSFISLISVLYAKEISTGLPLLAQSSNRQGSHVYHCTTWLPNHVMGCKGYQTDINFLSNNGINIKFALYIY